MTAEYITAFLNNVTGFKDAGFLQLNSEY